MLAIKEYRRKPDIKLLIDADTLDFLEMENNNITYCCGAPINRSKTVKNGPYKGAGPRYCSKCGVYLYKK